MDPWIYTHTGVRFNLANPTVDMVNIADIAHALSRICRYTGHVKTEHYSVAEHSVIVSRNVSEPNEMYALLHDAHEAYTGDVASPIKAAVGNAWREFEDRIAHVVRQRFGLSADTPPEVKEVDMDIQSAERLVMLPGSLAESDWAYDDQGMHEQIQCLGPAAAESLFMERLEEIADGMWFRRKVGE